MTISTPPRHDEPRSAPVSTLIDAGRRYREVAERVRRGYHSAANGDIAVSFLRTTMTTSLEGRGRLEGALCLTIALTVLLVWLTFTRYIVYTVPSLIFGTILWLCLVAAAR